MLHQFKKNIITKIKINEITACFMLHEYIFIIVFMREFNVNDANLSSDLIAGTLGALI